MEMEGEREPVAGDRLSDYSGFCQLGNSIVTDGCGRCEFWWRMRITRWKYRDGLWAFVQHFFLFFLGKMAFVQNGLWLLRDGVIWR